MTVILGAIVVSVALLIGVIIYLRRGLGAAIGNALGVVLVGVLAYVALAWIALPM
jgi:hypothetical protein